ncbi:MAG TPA: GIY-YIG nuclease family protein, partial [Candidatus Omnitrophota bacterium]|nr:GIY-YIG nuclease family protein [Candidatus Omnitrophota bacterium]
MDIKKKVDGLPHSPGVYIMRGSGEEVLYVGKAIDLRKRVASYFYPNRIHSARIELMVGKVRDISYIPTASEAEALIYENGLIKELRPKYNIALRDDKSYPMLKLTVNERFPRLFITRQKKDDGALYYGPYSDAGLLKKAVEALMELFPLRTCNSMGKRPCLNYHIKRCFAPCAGNMDEGRYGEMVDEARLFLEGRRAELLRSVSGRMAKAAREERFEDAAALKDRLDALSGIRGKAVKYGPSDEVTELGRVISVSGRPD